MNAYWKKMKLCGPVLELSGPAGWFIITKGNGCYFVDEKNVRRAGYPTSFNTEKEAIDAVNHFYRMNQGIEGVIEDE
jgi:hypothetical protein